MSADALVLMVVSLVVIWGGLITAILVLARQPENDHMPEGGEDTRVPD